MSTQRFLTVAQVAGRLGCSEWFVYKRIHAGELRAHRPGRKWLVTEENFENYVKACEVK